MLTPSLDERAPAEVASATRTKLFVDLTPDRVLAAVEAGGLSCTGLCYPLNSFENRVYEVELSDRTRVVAKFYRPARWSREQILEEHRFLAELAEEELPVCPVRPFPDGGTLREIDGISYALWPRVGGRAPDELDHSLAVRLGRLVARLHAVGARRTAGPRRPLDGERYARRPLDFLLRHRLVPPAFASRYADAARAVAEVYEEWVEGVPLHRIHADLHLGNLLLRDGTLSLVDFDDMAMGPAVQDLWLAVPGDDEASRALRGHLVAGYEELRALDPESLRLVEPLRGLRMIRYTGWIALRWHDPAFKVTWPEFGTEEYWQGATEDLEAQLARIRGRRPTVIDLGQGFRETEPVDPGDLTNADYFWDWEE